MRHEKQAARTTSRLLLFAIFLRLALGSDLGLAQTTLEIQVVEGQNAIQTASARSSAPLVLLVVDQAGIPVAGATVSLRLPDHDATGLFSNGLRTEIALTDNGGRATIHGIQWGAAIGTCQIRITALKGAARAGTVATIQITQPAAEPAVTASLAGDETVPEYRPPSKWKSRWTVIALAAAGAIGGGLVVKYSQPPVNGAAAIVPPAGISVTPLQVGPPVVVVNRP